MKSLDELSDLERKVLESLGERGMTLSGIQSKAGKGVKRADLYRALRILVDSELVGISTRGRMELYHKVNVQKSDEPKDSKKETEVK